MSLTAKQAAALHLAHDITASVTTKKRVRQQSRRPRITKKPVMFDGERYDSSDEVRRMKELRLLQHSGEIRGLQRKPEFLLLNTIRWNGETLKRRKYTADFEYIDAHTGRRVIEEVKSTYTANFKEYRRTRHMFLDKYILGHEETIEFREVIYR